MNLDARTRLVALAITAVGAICLAIFLSQKSFTAQVESRNWVVHTYQVLNTLDALLTDLEAVESGQRGFVITGDEQYLLPYTEASKHVDSEIDRLGELTNDNPAQQAYLTPLKEKIRERLESARDAIELRRNKGFGSARDFISSGAAERQTNEIRLAIANMRDVEKKLLSARLIMLEETTQETFVYTNVLRMLAITLVICGIFMSYHYLLKQQKTEKLLALQHSMSKIMNQSAALSESAPQLEKMICEWDNWTVSATWILDEHAEVLRLFHVHSPSNLEGSEFISVTKSKSFAKGEGLPGRVWADITVASIESVPSDNNLPRASQAAACGLISAFAFPIKYGEQFLGVVEVFGARKRKLDAQTRAVFESIGREIGQLIERQRAAERLAELAWTAEYVAGIALTLNSDESLEHILKSCTELTTNHINAALTRIWLLNSTGDTLELKASAGTYAQWHGSPASVLVGEYQIGTDEDVHQSIVSTDVSNDRRVVDKDWVTNEGIEEFVACPLVSGDVLFGVIDLFARKPLSPAVLAALDAASDCIVGGVQRRFAAKMAEESAMRFREVADNISEIFWISDNFGRTPIYVNLAYEQIYGRTRESLFADPKTFFEAIHPDDRDKMAEHIRSMRKGVTSTDLEFRIIRPSGSVRWLWARLKAVTASDNSVVYLCGVTGDITEKKAAEQRVKEFYSTVSHELRTPLTSIRGSLGLIEGGLTGSIPDKTMKMIKIARSESDRLIRLINDILDLQKIEAGMIKLKKNQVDINKLLGRTVESLKGMATSSDIRLNTRVSTNGMAFCDEDRIIQVLTNLASNAIKFSPKQSEIIISIDSGTNNTFRFSVSDQGPGIPDDQKHKLFGRFQQLDQSDKRKQGGTGLGLAITKGIVEEHGGRIGVDSEVGKGSTFWFEIPAAQVQPNLVELAATQNNHIRPALLIEDDPSITEVLKSHLEQENFAVVPAKSLAEARAVLRSFKPLVILLDLNLPDGDGLDLLQDLRADEALKVVPVVIVSGRDKDGAVKVSHPALIDWVEKPIDEAKLHACFDAVRKTIGPARVLLVEDDSSTREVFRQQLENLGATCLEAADGAEAIKMFRDTNPDLIILDLSIPPPDGFAVVDILNKEPNGHKPLVVYTALDLTDEKKQLLKLGLTAHLTKSVDSVEHVIETVRTFLDGLLPPKRDS